ncbi:MAG: DegT/DnrJ/EryC1/StrS family aminotransferase [Oscillospiraceae bacterium]|nr:DegT/DnrJ/EryC1/StrS family aminotransferase [Oscillospiraceae bacterium]
MAKLAINGGDPICDRVFPSWTTYTDADEAELLKAYQSNVWGMKGEQNQRFAERFAKYSGVKHCIPVANGTVSIELILRGLGIGRGDEVIVPPWTFIASISALIYAGVKPVFADIEKDTYLLSPESAEKMITPRTKAIMPVYVGGRAADLDAFEALCNKYGLYLIGDAAQAVGSEFNGKGIGNYGIATSISCQNSKNLTCGEGGIILTNDDTLYATIMQMLNTGRAANGSYSYLGLENGMSEFQASILNTQLDTLPAQIDKRMKNAAYLNKRLRELDFVYPLKADARITRDSYHLFIFGVREEKLKGVSRNDFLNAVSAEGVPMLAAGYQPAYHFPCLTDEYTERCIGGKINVNPDTPVSEWISAHESAWIYHSLLLGEQEDMDGIIAALIKVYENLDELAEEGRA